MGLNLGVQLSKNLSCEDFFKNTWFIKIVMHTYKISGKAKEMWKDYVIFWEDAPKARWSGDGYNLNVYLKALESSEML